MTILIFDVATTGLVHFTKKMTDPAQPRMMAIGAVLYTPQWVEKGSIDVLVRPEGWTPNAGAAAAHGITTRQCELYGMRQKAVLAMFIDMVRAASEIASYGFDFDAAVIHIELLKLGARPEEWRRGRLQRTCIMTAAAQRYNGGINMKLPDAHKRATGTDYNQRHIPIEDARAAASILMGMRNDF